MKCSWLSLRMCLSHINSKRMQPSRPYRCSWWRTESHSSKAPRAPQLVSGASSAHHWLSALKTHLPWETMGLAGDLAPSLQEAFSKTLKKADKKHQQSPKQRPMASFHRVGAKTCLGTVWTAKGVWEPYARKRCLIPLQRDAHPCLKRTCNARL